MKEDFRAYYDETGKVLFFTGSGFPKEGTYINISKEVYVKYSDWRYLKVIDGKLVEEMPSAVFNFKLQKVKNGKFKTVKNHAGLLLEKDETYNEIDNYDTKSS